MKKVGLLMLVAAVVGTAVFFFASRYFQGQQIESRIRELSGMLKNMSVSTQTAMDRNWWASTMPPGDADIAAEYYKPGVSFGRQEWYGIWSDDAAEGGAHFVRNVEKFHIGDPSKDPRYAPLGGLPVTWTWHQGIPGEWGERVQMSAIFIYENQEWKIGGLELLSKTDNTEPPVSDPR